MVSKAKITKSQYNIVFRRCYRLLVFSAFLAAIICWHRIPTSNSGSNNGYGSILIRDNVREFCSSLREWENIAAQSCNKMDKRIFDLVVVSTGGVGTTSTLETLATNWRVNSVVDNDGLKHRPFYTTTTELKRMVLKNKSLECATPLFVYAIGDVAASIFSLYRRRGFAEAQNFKTREFPIPKSCFPSDIDGYINDKVDYLGIESHFHSYVLGGLCSVSVPVLFMRVERNLSPKVWKTIERAIENPIQSFEKNHEELEMTASHYEIDSKTSERYQKLHMIYKRLQRQLDDLGHLSIAFKGKVSRII